MSEVSTKINILGFSQTQMEAFFKTMDEPKFRAVQVMKWIHQFGADDFESMSNVSKKLREKLTLSAEIIEPEVLYRGDSKDGTRKWVIGVSGGNKVEMVLIPDGDRATLCVSSQVGCALDCSFCSTGKQGFNRNLTAAGGPRPKLLANCVLPLSPLAQWIQTDPEESPTLSLWAWVNLCLILIV